ncbi:uncharacterized protein LAESUDRAFT_657038 [Laetiporus sulphureus 93-53]|uniref:Xylanolytic transcriptional activator regulatory domain-containing protein n=1 Tax=Laetiporus sulphureus 93-53 TaxID=1314785 RepID=A0A165DH42_9APHY|nr:uncharacterized protein LAESUDRAFT_657038 [Laetiporus sulphureus 93-53]KZT04865.1 hypothetical protein LAESUDRAFT_657038 [Laetiporus sulphureus 93-53]
MPPPLSGSFASSTNPGGGKETQTSHFVPPIPYDTFLPENLPSTHVTVGSLFPELHGAGKTAQPPQVTAKLLAHLPAKELRPKYMRALEETMMLHPCFNVRHFAQRVDAMFAWGEAGSVSPSALSLTAASTDPGSQTKAALAREVFFGQPPPPVGKGKANAKTGAGQQHGAGNSPKPTLSFFAASCAAFALGALVCKSNSTSAIANPSQPQESTDRPSTASSSSSSSASQAQAQVKEDEADPAALFALADQALGLFEKTSLYDLDAVIAMILQILYHLHDGQMSVAQGVFPLVGKMINVARMMGLAIDPDEFPGTYNLFEAETRRRIWWDVFYYDLFISDCMGHLPLIPDNSFTTRMPADVDEEQFTPSSLSLPTASTGEGAEKGTAYFSLKCR